MIFLTKFRQWMGVELVELSAVEKLVSSLAAVLAMAVLMVFSWWFLGHQAAAAVVASMGASAVLLYAVPHGPLSQPWPVLAGHGLSAVIGVICARWVPDPILAASLAVGLSIGVMIQFKCIHPPGGATAFTAVMGGPAIHDLGFGFVLCPVLLNAMVMVLLAVLLNAAFHWRRYPAGLNSSRRLQPQGPAPSSEQIHAAVRSLDSFVDISEDDLRRLTELLAPVPAFVPAIPPSGPRFRRRRPAGSKRAEQRAPSSISR